MRPAKIIAAIASLNATVNAHVLRSADNGPAPALEVTLSPAVTGEVAELIVTIKNVGPIDLNLLRVGTLLDEVLPIRRVKVVDEAGVEAPFRGIYASVRHDALKPQNFLLLKTSESATTTIKTANVYEFNKTGKYTFSAMGLMPVALAGSTELSGPAVPLRSNDIALHVDAQMAAAVDRTLNSPILKERTNLQDGCNSTQLAASTAALRNCETLALAAAADAANPSSSRFVEYFGTNSSATRQTVVDRLTAVAKECSTTNSGPSRYYCYDLYGICETDGPLNAYTKFDFNYVVMCPLFYDTLPPLPQGCHRQDQATTSIHEFTHCQDVYSPFTGDYTYGYNDSVALPPEQALLNADNYSLYANAVYMKC